MASEADIQAERESYAEEKDGLAVMVIGWPFGQGTARETLTEDGGLDIYKHGRSRGIRPMRDPGSAKVVEKGVLRRLLSGARVTCKGNYMDRELAREGVQMIQEDDEDKGWTWVYIEK